MYDEEKRGEIFLADKQNAKPASAAKKPQSSKKSVHKKSKPDPKKQAEIRKYIRQRKRKRIIALYVVSLFLLLFYLIPGEKVWLILHEYYWGLFGFLGIFVPILNIYSARQMRKKKMVYRLAFQNILFSVTLMMFGSTVYAFGSQGIELSDYITELAESFGKGGQHIGAGIAGGLWGVPITKIFGPTGGGIISLFIFVVLFYNCLKVLFGDVVEQFKEPVIEKITETVQMQSAVREEEQRIKAIQRKRAVEEFERRKAEKRAALEKNEQEQAEHTEEQENHEEKDNLFVRLRHIPIYRPDLTKHKKKKKLPAKEKSDIVADLDKKEENISQDMITSSEILDEEVVFAEMSKPQEQEVKEPEIEEPQIQESKVQLEKKETLPLNMDFVGGDIAEFPERSEVSPLVLKNARKPDKKPEKKKKERVVISVEDIKKYVTEGEQLTLVNSNYLVPPFTLLEPPEKENEENVSYELNASASKLVETLKSFGVQTTVTHVSRGPSVTRYELQPASGVKISKITNLADDIALNLAATGVRIEAPIPGKSAVGIEVPNKNVSIVRMRSLVESKEFQNAKSKLTVVLGVDITGKITLADLSKMPHLLIAGATGSGKSVCVNSMLVSLLYKASPEEVKLMLIDPKVVELGVYNGIPHLLVPVVTDPRKAAGALNWAVNEMLERYKTFAEHNVRDMHSYNRLVDRQNAHIDDNETIEEPERTFEEDEMLAQAKADIVNEEPKTKEVHKLEKMCQIVIVIDELADLMMAAPNEVEESICRLAQMARAAGMHLVIATQRPSVDVITGLIKANVPSRIAFAVKSQIDSRTILDSGGAEKLLGKGDMLFSPIGTTKPVRVQGGFVDDDEVEKIVNFVKNNKIVEYDKEVIEEIEKNAVLDGKVKDTDTDSEADPMIEQAIECVVEAGQASTSLLQRRLRVGYARAGRLVDDMEKMGIVGPHQGAKPRDVLMTRQQLLDRQLANTQ